MTYPISDHYNGSTFFNPEPSNRPMINPPTGPSDGSNPAKPTGHRMGMSLLLARIRRKRNSWSKWPGHIENKSYPAPRQAVPAGSAGISFIGHSSFLIRLPGLNVLTDPVFSKRASPFSFAGPKRVRAPGIALDALPQIDLTLLSHNHYDHMDLAALRRLRKRFPEMRIVAPLGNAAYLAKKGLPDVAELDWWQTITLGETVITATPARHFAARWLDDRDQTLWAGFMLQHRGASIYFAGDSGYTKYFAEIRQKLGSPAIALLPIGAYEPRWFMNVVHMNPADAVQAFRDLNPAQAIGMHFGTFQMTAEPIDQPEIDLALAKTQAGLETERFVTLDCGETRIFPAGETE